MCGGATAWRLQALGSASSQAVQPRSAGCRFFYDHLRLVNQISLVRWNQGDFLLTRRLWSLPSCSLLEWAKPEVGPRIFQCGPLFHSRQAPARG